MSKWPNGDIRNLVIGGRLNDTNMINSINTLDDLLNHFRENVKSYNALPAFEVVSKSGNIKNKLKDYLDFLQTDYYLVKLTRDQALRFYGRPNFLANYLYGNPSMAWVIMILNELNHPSEMNMDLLLSGIKILNTQGISKLTKIINLFTRIDTIEGDGMMYGEEV